MTWVLGISAFYHDAAAALLRDGEIVAAAQEERFSRVKGDARFPARAAQWCLTEAGIAAGDLEHVVFYEKPWLHLERVLETHLAVAPSGLGQFIRAAPGWLGTKLGVRRAVREHLDWDGAVAFVEHHAAHRAAAFFASPYPRAAILTVDGVGEWVTASIARGEGARIEVLDEMDFPSSLGLFYAAVTAYLGFEVNSDEYRVMGLAPYGQPRYAEVLRAEAVQVCEDGSLRLDPRCFALGGAQRFTTARLHDLLGGPPRAPEAPIEDRHRDVAASVQRVTEDVILRMAKRAHERTGERDLTLAGGVALNAVANGRLLREGPFDRIWVQPAAGDAGSAIGAALAFVHERLDRPREADGSHDRMRGAALGPSFGAAAAHAALDRGGLTYRALPPAALAAETARVLDEGKIVALCSGRMEMGPRALGHRSILADPRRADVKDVLNARVKWREAFRPFAPAVLAERAGDLFDLGQPAPYMTIVVPVKPDAGIPGATHVDGSARVQTVEAGDGPIDDILRAFDARTGCPALINTSFNVRGEPIVCTPDDAVHCFRSTDIDVLVIEDAFCDQRVGPAPTGSRPTARDAGPPPVTPRAARRRARTMGISLALLLGAMALLRPASAALFAEVGAAVVLVLTALLRPLVLEPPRRLLAWLGNLVGAVLRPPLLAAVYLIVLTPYGLIRRRFGSPIRVPRASTYWHAPRPDARGTERWTQPF